MNKIIELYTSTEGRMYLSDGETMWDVTDSETTIKQDTQAIADGLTDDWITPRYTFDEQRAMREHPMTRISQFEMENKNKTSIYDI